MENQKQYPMTQEGFEKLERELEELKTVKRPEVVEKIKVARSFGDLSENSEYDAAKDEQGFIEQDIQRIEHMLRNALIIEDTGDNNVVKIGKTVTFVELPGDEEESYQIVGSAESDAFNGKISNESPMAKALIGKGLDDEVRVPLPNGGEMNVKIVNIQNQKIGQMKSKILFLSVRFIIEPFYYRTIIVRKNTYDCMCTYPHKCFIFVNGISLPYDKYVTLYSKISFHILLEYYCHRLLDVNLDLFL